MKNTFVKLFAKLRQKDLLQSLFLSKNARYSLETFLPKKTPSQVIVKQLFRRTPLGDSFKD